MLYEVITSALGSLVQVDCPQREEALAAFEARWREDPLVMDKWFSVQAMATRENVLDEVVRLV